MRILSKRTLRLFWETHPQTASPLVLWYERAKAARWSGPDDVRKDFGSADFVAGNRMILNIGGNKYRIVAYIAYRSQTIMVKFVGTHKDDDRIDPENVG